MSIASKKENLLKAREGENIAKRYLVKKGYRIIDRNYRTRYSEIDLIAEDRGVLVFVEVRTKQNEKFGRPEDTIDRGKISKLIRNAYGYLGKNALCKTFRIDVICVILGEDNERHSINHYENITLYLS